MKNSCLLCLLITCFSFSQNKQVLYGFNEIPQSLMLNPGAQISNDWYVGMPLLSQLHVNVGMSGISVYDVFAEDGRDFNSKLRDAIYNMDSNDHFAVNQQLEIISGGFAFGNSYEKDQYLSFGLYQETDVMVYFPKDYAILAYEGNQSNINRIFDLSHLNASAEIVSVFHVGYNKKLHNKLTVGARGKIYSSLINFNSTKNTGTFVTTPGENNYYKHTFNLDLELRTSGAGSLLNDDNSDFSEDLNQLRSRVLFGGNLGLGIDIGFTYQPTEQWTVSASLQDIGFISHSKDVENYKLDGTYEFEGINPIFEESEQGQTAEEYWDEIADEFEDLFTLDTTNTKYSTWRPLKLNAALTYSFGEKVSKECNCLQGDSGYLNAVGAHLFAINRPKQPQLALTAFYYRQLFDQIRLKATYTVDSYSFTNVGLGMSAHLGGINFYLMADNLLEFQNLAKAQSVSLQLGFNYIFKKNEN